MHSDKGCCRIIDRIRPTGGFWREPNSRADVVAAPDKGDDAPSQEQPGGVARDFIVCLDHCPREGIPRAFLDHRVSTSAMTAAAIVQTVTGEPARAGPARTGRVRVLVGDDQPIFRRGVVDLLAAEPDLLVVAGVDDGGSAFEAITRLMPRVAVLDARLPPPDGVAVTRAVRADPALADRVDVVLLTASDAPAAVYEAVRAGAAGVVLKDTPAALLVAAVRAVAAGHGWVDPRLARPLMAEFAARPEAASTPPSALRALTGRERQILALTALGRSNEEIARRLVIAEGTVKTHLARVLTKLRLENRAQAVAVAYQCGLITVTRCAPAPARQFA